MGGVGSWGAALGTPAGGQPPPGRSGATHCPDPGSGPKPFRGGWGSGGVEGSREDQGTPVSPALLLCARRGWGWGGRALRCSESPDSAQGPPLRPPSGRKWQQRRAPPTRSWSCGADGDSFTEWGRRGPSPEPTDRPCSATAQAQGLCGAGTRGARRSGPAAPSLRTDGVGPAGRQETGFPLRPAPGRTRDGLVLEEPREGTRDSAVTGVSAATGAAPHLSGGEPGDISPAGGPPCPRAPRASPQVQGSSTQSSPGRCSIPSWRFSLRTSGQRG